METGSQAVAHGGFDPSLADIAKVGAGGLTGAIGLWLANRLLGKAAFQQAINAGFSSLLDQLRRDNAMLRRELEEERTHALQERLSFERRLSEHFIQAATERLSLEGEIADMKQTVISLEHQLKAAGLLPNVRDRTITPIHGLRVIPPSDKLEQAPAGNRNDAAQES